MVENKKRIEITVEETGQSFTLVANELIGQVRSILLNKRKFDIASRPWNALDKETQQSEIDKLENFAEELVIGIVEIVAAGNMEVIHAKFDGMTMKPDGSMIVKVAGYAEDDALVDLNHMRGKLLKITAVDQSQFDQHREAEKADGNQGDLLEDDDTEQQVDSDGESLDPETGEFIKIEQSVDVPDEYLYQKVSEWVLANNNCLASSIIAVTGINKEDCDSILERMFDEGLLAKGEDDYIIAPKSTADAMADAIASDPDATEAEKAALSSDNSTAKPDSETDTADTEPQPSDEVDDFGDVESDEACSSPAEKGQQAALDGRGKDDCPFDGGTPEHDEWRKSYDAGCAEIEGLRQKGYDARKDGKSPSHKNSGWKESSREHAFWLEGYNLRKKDEEDGPAS